MNTSTETTERGKYPTFCPTWENQRHFILLFVQPASKWELAVKNTEGAFIKKLEKKVKPMKLATEGEGDYKLIIRFTKIDFGDTAAGVLSSLTVFGSSKAGGAKFTGEVELIDNTGKSLCVLSFIEAKGTRSDSNQLRFTVGMLDLANYICKALK